LACAPGAAVRALDDAPPPVTAILAAYERATLGAGADADVQTLETTGTLAGEGLTGAFHTWRSGNDERDDESLGPRTETTLRLGSRMWVRNANGNVQELTGVLLRRAATEEFIESDAFLRAPERSRFTGFGTVGDRRTWNLEVAAAGGDPETLWIDAESGLPLRTSYLDGDGPTYVDLSDWRDVDGMKIAFHAVTSDGEHAFDTIEQTSSVTIGRPIDPRVFAPLAGDRLIADGVQTVPLMDGAAGVTCTVQVGGKSYAFLVDSGSGNVLLDTHVAQAAGVREVGSLEVRGAVRSGGLRVARLPRLTIGSAELDGLVVSTLDFAASGRGRIDGILGFPFFATSVVQLDFPHLVMRFGPPGSLTPPGDRIPLDTDREIPEAVFRIDGAVDAPFMVDTGNGGGVLLYAPFVARHQALVPAGVSDGTSYYGIGGSNRTYRTRLGSFALGSTVIAPQSVDVVLATQGAFADRIDAGNVGLGVLRSFVVTFDYPDHALYLERAVPDAPARGM
jgi:hypothetical protein